MSVQGGVKQISLTTTQNNILQRLYLYFNKLYIWQVKQSLRSLNRNTIKPVPHSFGTFSDHRKRSPSQNDICAITVADFQ